MLEPFLDKNDLTIKPLPHTKKLQKFCFKTNYKFQKNPLIKNPFKISKIKNLKILNIH